MKKFFNIITYIYTIFLFGIYSLTIYIYTAYVFYDTFGAFAAIISCFFPIIGTIFMFILQSIAFGLSSGFVTSILNYLLAFIIYFILLKINEIFE